MGSLYDTSAPAVSVWYASHLGLFADKGAELFTPWDWHEGMWEVMHLFTHYGQPTRVQSTSSLDSLVSAYSSINSAGDSLTVILVNRDQSNTQTTTVNLKDFTSSSAAGYQLSGLSGETFVSNTNNALKSVAVSLSGGSFTLTLPALSITAVQVGGKAATGIATHALPHGNLLLQGRRLTAGAGDAISVFSLAGRPERTGTGSLSLEGIASGVYLAHSGNQTLRVVLP
jgi:hypothetical protein